MEKPRGLRGRVEGKQAEKKDLTIMCSEATDCDELGWNVIGILSRSNNDRLTMHYKLIEHARV